MRKKRVSCFLYRSRYKKLTRNLFTRIEKLVFRCYQFEYIPTTIWIYYQVEFEFWATIAVSLSRLKSYTATIGTHDNYWRLLLIIVDFHLLGNLFGHRGFHIGFSWEVTNWNRLENKLENTLANKLETDWQTYWKQFGKRIGNKLETDWKQIGNGLETDWQ